MPTKLNARFTSSIFHTYKPLNMCNLIGSHPNITGKKRDPFEPVPKSGQTTRFPYPEMMQF